MANPVKGEVAFEVGSETYTLVLDFNAICELEDATDAPSAETFARVERGFVSELARILWAALQRHHGEMSLRDARDLVGEVGPEEIGKVIEKAVSVSSLTAEGSAKPGKPKKRTGTG